ncbi:DUF6879 family protein [Nocardiopsis suaedae]|uniref:DUF6879 domain-containing protein n=1 Tax=Nocardiopsis suaedae TaxID=3018444 RepID=A0ABT4TF55_9ACTN|nr:DUF6879 family protein [Nocardiopsis suaedae]MDA2803312.1 hypothetical protein [Nocardiopsis suaedae]
MTDPHAFEAVYEARGTVLGRADYHADAKALRESPDITGDVWKLERSQRFDESGDEAWEAYLAGDMSRAIAIFEGERERLREQVARYAGLGLRMRRLRVAEWPPSGYLRWEMHSHRVFVECGYEIAVLDAERIGSLERRRPLPETMVYGDRVVYQVLYDRWWAPAGAKRIDDPVLARRVADAIAVLYARAEPFMDFYRREIARGAEPGAGPGSGEGLPARSGAALADGRGAGAGVAARPQGVRRR